MTFLKKMFGTRTGGPQTFRVPPHTRVYAIGDIHGRLDLLLMLIDRIEQHGKARPCEREYIVFLGDLIDRGPESRGVIEYLMRARAFLPNPIFLAGNHEEMLLQMLAGDSSRIHEWLSYGGAQFVESYGLDPAALDALSPEEVAVAIRKAVPEEHLRFLADFADSFKVGDYFFTHAGIRPGVPLAEQSIHDLHWIREDFLGSPARFPAMIVHGHTISPTPDEHANRIGIDTGAYMTGVLTALCVEGDTREFLRATS